LHPEKYFAGDKPTGPDLPDPKLPRSYKSLIGGSMGELDHEVLLEQYAGKAESEDLGPHWRGSAFELLEDKKAMRVVLRYAVQWDTAETARRYFNDYRQVLAKKWKQLKIASETADAVAGQGDDGRFELRLDGVRVTSVEGLPVN
jgi:GH15 family glucan-1,4-alpha-glucosidase